MQGWGHLNLKGEHSSQIPKTPEEWVSWSNRN